MAKAKARPQAKGTPPPETVRPHAPNDDRSPLDRMRDLTRRVIAVPRGEVTKPIAKKRHRVS